MKQTKTLRFSKDTIDKCAILAKNDHRSLNNFIERLMEKAISDSDNRINTKHNPDKNIIEQSILPHLEN